MNHSKPRTTGFEAGPCKYSSLPVAKRFLNFQSYLDVLCGETGEYAWFQGTLDAKTLTGAGFVRQKTSKRSKTWDLSGTSGVLLDLLAADGNAFPSNPIFTFLCDLGFRENGIH